MLINEKNLIIIVEYLFLQIFTSKQYLYICGSKYIILSYYSREYDVQVFADYLMPR